MIKRLVFSFYLEKEGLDNETNKLHFSCLSRYSHIFDEINITIIKDCNVSDDVLVSAKKKFVELNQHAKITIRIIDNNSFRESIVFKTEVVDKLSDNVLVFFAHNKGVSNIKKYNPDVIYTWIAAMYFYNLEFMPEVIDSLVNRKYYSYGTFLTKNEEPERCNKYGWYYIGTFFWINSGKLYNYIKNQDIEIPKMSDRFYDEEFLGNIYPTWPFIYTASHGNMYLNEADNYYLYAKDYLEMLYPERDDFNEFFKEVRK